MESKEVTRKDGTTVRVYASDKDALDKAVKETESLETVTYPNINVPVAKGHDLLEVDESLNTKLVDGTGAHNSPRDAVRDDGSLEGDPKVASPGAGEAPEKAVGTGAPVGDPTIDEPKEESKSDTSRKTLQN